MKLHQGIQGLRSLPPRAVISVGNFDGIHRGHANIVRDCKQLAQEHSSSGIVIVTFEPHPLTVLKPEIAPPRLTTLEMKRDLLESLGVDHLVVLPPTKDVLDLSAEAFWHILRDEVRPTDLVEGETFNFGKDRGGNIARLREWSKDTDVNLRVIAPVSVALLDLQIVPVSSSIIRWLLGHGRVRDAGICLNRPYALRGTVVMGHQRGRTIGIPTANLNCNDLLIPADGVYAGRCTIDGATYPAAVSIGTMPTFGTNSRQIEAHLLDFTGDLYGQMIDVQLIDWVRDQRRFAAVDALKQQLGRDIQSARELATPRVEPIAATV